ncbi:hypothetical protein [Methylocella sp.]|uniref:hypothetical protein n=1 Tax=Methylocella sp. TaxID=1978226 RepID=UPI0035AF3A29
MEADERLGRVELHRPVHRVGGVLDDDGAVGADMRNLRPVEADLIGEAALFDLHRAVADDLGRQLRRDAE